jgi:putative alpha-1,2-mannosidase
MAYYTDMSIWDVHRTEFPWLGKIFNLKFFDTKGFFEPTILRDIVRSLVLMYKQGGDLPMWPMANGNHSHISS